MRSMWYVIVAVAPARRIASRLSSTTRSASTQPARSPATCIAYSAEVWYATTGTQTFCVAVRITSRYGPAGFTIALPSALAPSRLTVADGAGRLVREVTATVPEHHIVGLPTGFYVVTADIGTVDLDVVAEMDDGREIVRKVRIDTVTGAVVPLDEVGRAATFLGQLKETQGL